MQDFGVSARVERAFARRLTVGRFAQRLVARPTNARGDVLDPATAVLLALDRRVAGTLNALASVERKRADMRRSSWLASADPPELPVRDGRLPSGLAFRAYEPSDAMGGLVFFHGGGWVVGDLDSHDGLCRRLAARARHRVIAVDYPLAPEHPFPAPVHACRAAWDEALAELGRVGVPAERVAIGGDSAGGNLAAAVCRLTRGGRAPRGQLLVYPAVDATRSCPSHREFAEGFLLTDESIRWYLSNYAPDARDPLASPVLADDLDGLPPAVISVAGFDPLRDEGLWYAEKLRDAGVPVCVLDERGLIHGYASMDGLVPEASAAVDRLADALREL